VVGAWKSADQIISGGPLRVYGGVARLAALRLQLRRLDQVRVDWVAAGALTVSGEIEVLVGSGAPNQIVGMLATPLLTATVAVRRRYPAGAGVVAGLLGVGLTTFLGGISTMSWGIAWMCAMYGLAVWAPQRRFAIGLTIVALATLSSAAVPGMGVRALNFGVISTAVILLVHRIVGDRERRAQVAERERDVGSREAVLVERARIARELHDVIAHNVSMIVVQAGAERRTLGPENSSSREVLQTIEHIGRGALTEMRRLVDMLRDDGGQPLAPQPGLAEVPELVAQIREAGVPIELNIEGAPTDLPIGLELAAYRIVQEALTNTLKHALDARATVNIRYGGEALELEIADDGSGSDRHPNSRGHGLIGMRERVTLYGGYLDATPGSNGGFVVRARLPIA
jgi:signal transduction histidine kinase